METKENRTVNSEQAKYAHTIAMFLAKYPNSLPYFFMFILYMYISFYKQKATKAFTFVADKDKNMEESKRQKQVAAVLQDGLNGIFMKLGLSMIDGGLVSLAKVMVTPDLLEARIYISLFQVENPTLALQQITDRGWEIKKMLSEKVKHQLRRIPVLHYYLDDTLDHVFKMEALFAKIQQEKAALLPMKNDLQ